MTNSEAIREIDEKLDRLCEAVVELEVVRTVGPQINQ